MVTKLDLSGNTIVADNISATAYTDAAAKAAIKNKTEIAALVAVTDGSTGTANDATGIGAISDSATKNAVATLAAKVNAIIAALKA